VVCLAIIFERVWLYGASRLAPPSLPTRWSLRCARESSTKPCRRLSPAARRPSAVYHVLVAAAQQLDRDHLVELDEERRFQETLELKRYSGYFATAGSSAPFIGLFGTVVGILVAFQSMASWALADSRSSRQVFLKR